MKLKYKVPLILFGIAITGPPRPRFNEVEAVFRGNLDRSNMFDVFVWGLIILYTFNLIIRYVIIKKKNFILKYLKGPVKYYFLYAIFAVISTLFSVLPLYTLYFSLKFLSLFLLALYIIDIYKNDAWILYKIVFNASLVMFFIKAILYFYDPSLVGTYSPGFYRMTGGWLGGYGIYSAFVGIWAFLSLGKRRQLNKLIITRLFFIILFFIATYFVLLSRTRQTYLFYGLTLIILMFYNPKFRFFKYNLFIISVLLIVIITYWGIQADLFRFLVRDYKSLSTLSGRIIVMQYLIDVFSKHIILGDGFAIGTKYWLIKGGFHKWGFGAAHESIGSVLVDLGVIGALLLIFVIILSWIYNKKIYGKLNLLIKNKSLYLLYLLVFSHFIYLTASVISSPTFSMGKWPWIVALVTLIKINEYILNESTKRNL